MATLEKIRSKAGLLIIVVGVALFAFIIGDFLNSGSTYFRQTQEKIASVNGENISIQDYQARIEEMLDVYKMQTGNSNVQEEVMTQIRQSVFQSMTREIVLGEKAELLGLTVSSDELFDMVQGENISPVIQQMPMFVNQQTGRFDKTALLNFLKRIGDDNTASYSPEQQAQLEQMRRFWLFWERSIKQQRLEEKYTALLTKAVSANVLDAKAEFDETAESTNFRYVVQNYATIPDSLVQVSKSDVEKLYNQRKQNYKQAEGKVINYIAVDVVPSADDFAKAQTEIEGLKEEFTTSSNVAELVNEYSEIPFINAYSSENAFDADVKQFITTAEVGEVNGPLFADNKYRMFKLVDKITAPDSVKVSQIMVAAQTEAQTVALVDSLMDVLKKGADFAEVARKHSMDQMAQNGGEVGWMTEVSALGWLNEEFKDAVFGASVNEVKSLKTMYGTVIVKVTEKTANVKKYKVANIEMTVSPSSKTYSDLYNELNHYISVNNTIEKFDENAQTAGYNLMKDITVNKSEETLVGIPRSRQVIRWAFQQSKKGIVSEIFECDDKFVAIAVQGTVPEGYRSLAYMTPQLEKELKKVKKGEKIVNDLKAQNLTSLEAYGQAMNSSIQTVNFLNFGTSRISGIGLEPKLNALASVAPLNQLSQPVIGNEAVYVFEAVERNPEEKTYNEEEQVSLINSSNSYRYGYQAVQSLINNSEIVDNRIRFY
ncbi:peptidylprolyl isomerase [Parabacteroides sp. 52]|uniref:peptidylprolyl isomerase n=1 Tax=unclassified Parabacteroides TaxID=2649774 RepID=UPI0013D46E87|nr:MULTISPECIES: peptidylprolyl isomerase [unclassified Parabacteroides]MDH6533978.1 peptidyl-prolyl cis-trans isomerase D [Parabacteroides sp. PM5-20]NDV54719.1 peptidylprolyl isomerase [Parabacteroides sp. 52]